MTLQRLIVLFFILWSSPSAQGGFSDENCPEKHCQPFAQVEVSARGKAKMLEHLIDEQTPKMAKLMVGKKLGSLNLLKPAAECSQGTKMSRSEALAKCSHLLAKDMEISEVVFGAANVTCSEDGSGCKVEIPTYKLKIKTKATASSMQFPNAKKGTRKKMKEIYSGYVDFGVDTSEQLRPNPATISFNLKANYTVPEKSFKINLPPGSIDAHPSTSPKSVKTHRARAARAVYRKFQKDFKFPIALTDDGQERVIENLNPDLTQVKTSDYKNLEPYLPKNGVPGKKYAQKKASCLSALKEKGLLENNKKYFRPNTPKDCASLIRVELHRSLASAEKTLNTWQGLGGFSSVRSALGATVLKAQAENKIFNNKEGMKKIEKMANKALAKTAAKDLNQSIRSLSSEMRKSFSPPLSCAQDQEDLSKIEKKANKIDQKLMAINRRLAKLNRQGAKHSRGDSHTDRLGKIHDELESIGKALGDIDYEGLTDLAQNSSDPSSFSALEKVRTSFDIVARNFSRVNDSAAALTESWKSEKHLPKGFEWTGGKIKINGERAKNFRKTVLKNLIDSKFSVTSRSRKNDLYLGLHAMAQKTASFNELTRATLSSPEYCMDRAPASDFKTSPKAAQKNDFSFQINIDAINKHLAALHKKGCFDVCKNKSDTETCSSANKVADVLLQRSESIELKSPPQIHYDQTKKKYFLRMPDIERKGRTLGDPLSGLIFERDGAHLNIEFNPHACNGEICFGPKLSNSHLKPSGLLPVSLTFGVLKSVVGGPFLERKAQRLLNKFGKKGAALPHVQASEVITQGNSLIIRGQFD